MFLHVSLQPVHCLNQSQIIIDSSEGSFDIIIRSPPYSTTEVFSYSQVLCLTYHIPKAEFDAPKVPANMANY